jgi:hypothetical protein
MRDWISHPAWGPVGAFIGILSLLPPAPLLQRTIIFIIIIAASVYAFIAGSNKRKRTVIDSPPPVQVQQRYPPIQGVLNHRTLPTQPQQRPPVFEETSAAAVPMPTLTLRDRIFGFIMYSVMFGLPGFLLVRSDVSWMHVVGVILLILCAFAVISSIFPEGADAMEKHAKRGDALTYRLNRMASQMSEAHRPQEGDKE